MKNDGWIQNNQFQLFHGFAIADICPILEGATILATVLPVLTETTQQRLNSLLNANDL